MRTQRLLLAAQHERSVRNPTAVSKNETGLRTLHCKWLWGCFEQCANGRLRGAAREAEHIYGCDWARIEIAQVHK